MTYKDHCSFFLGKIKVDFDFKITYNIKTNHIGGKHGNKI